MIVSPRTLKWMMRLYPPLFFQRIWVKKVHADFKRMDIKIVKSWLNGNHNSSIFGGTLFTAVDPMHAVLLAQICYRKGITKIISWSKSTKIEYLKPARKNVEFSVQLLGHEIEEVLEQIKKHGKAVRTFEVEILDRDGLCCARSQNEIYIRDLNFDAENATPKPGPPHKKPKQ